MKTGFMKASGARSQIKIDPTLQPKHDPEFSRLFEAALKGELPLYFAAVPRALCIPFDLDYRPDLHPIGKQAIDEFIEEWRKGNFQNLTVYPRGRWYAVSDDYITLFAALIGQPDYLPFFIMGKPDPDMLRDLQGPISDVRTAFGFASGRES